jgi:mannose-6-phosphate isomerase-like protein (cupin superfamily)
MYIRDLEKCEAFYAADDSLLREILHPDKADLKLRYSLAHATVSPGQTTLPHKLKTSEVYYILEGEGVMHIDGESAKVGPGQTIYIPIILLQNIGIIPLQKIHFGIIFHLLQNSILKIRATWI